jgi:hypothetical protein
MSHRAFGCARSVQVTSRFRLDVHLVPGGEDVAVLTGVTLRGADVSDTAVPVIVVVPAHERARPKAGLLQIRKSLRGELGAILGGAEQDSTKALSSLTRGRE